MVWSDPAPRSARRSPLRDVPVPEALPEGPSPTCPSDLAAKPLRYRSPGGAQFFAGLSLRRPRAHLPDLHRDAPASPGGILPHVSVLHRESVLIVGRDTGVKSGAEHSHRFPCLAENPMRFCLFRCSFGGYFRAFLPHGLILSF